MKLLVLSMMSAMFFSTDTMAKETGVGEDNIRIGDVINNNNDKKDVVIRINDDNSFVTSIPENLLLRATTACSHTNLSVTSSYTEREWLNTASFCYRLRNIDNAKCGKCGKIGFKSYGKWEKYTHKYPFLSSKCSICGYKK